MPAAHRRDGGAGGSDVTDFAKIGLPLQIAGFAVLIGAAIAGNVPATRIGLAVHFAGDALFFFAMKRKGCL
jgi:hypothetical protein